ncbi:MAG: hypothetical protein ACRDXX_17565 [Stackebrandtia sp.]
MTRTKMMPPQQRTGTAGVEVAKAVNNVISVTDLADRLATDLAAERATFENGYRLGYATGYDVGRCHGEAESDAQWSWAIAGIQRLADRPGRAELERQRSELITGPCGAPSCGGRCSRCVRAAAVANNRRRFGSDDFPGEAR